MQPCIVGLREAREPHPKSDIDFVLVADRQYWMGFHHLLKDTIQVRNDHRYLFDGEIASLI